VAFVPPVSAAQQRNPAEVRVRLELISEAGGSVSDATVTVLSVAEGSDPRVWRRLRSESGIAFLDLEGGLSYRITVVAPGHREGQTELTARRSGSLRIVLPVDPYELPAIVASANGDRSESPARTVDHVRFTDTGLTYATVGEWLADLPGGSPRGPGPGGRQALSIRASREEDVLVLLDGVPLNDPITGRADLSTLPTSTLESATLVRGAASQRYGSGASSGALLLSSRRAEGTGLGGGVNLGSFGSRGLDAQLDLSSGGRRLGLSMSAKKAENDFSFRNPLGLRDVVETRSNADISSLHATAHGALGAWFGSLRFDATERGVPGRAGTSLFESARAEDRAWTGAIGLEKARGRVSASYAWRSVGYRPSSELAPESNEVRELRVAGDVSVPASPVTLGGRLTRESVEGDNVGSPAVRTLVGVRAAGVLRTGLIRVDPALSLDASDGRTVLSPELGITWSVDGRTRIWGRIGQGFRLPTFGDLYFASQYRLRPNPDLDPERITYDAEVGASGGIPVGKVVLSLAGSVWTRRTEGPIVWISSAVAVWSPQNLGTLDADGLEVRLAVEPSRVGRWGWRGGISGTLQDSRVGFGTNENPLPYEPEGTAHIGLEAWRGSVGGKVDLRYTGPRTTSLAATRTLDGFLTADLSLRQSLKAGSLDLGVFLKVENLLDRRYQLVELFPEPGRRLSVRLEARRTTHEQR
jgi:iron complex outermembrane receptor protein